MNRFKIPLKYILVLFLLVVIVNKVEAKKLKGFIVTEQNDTIYGSIKVNKYNPRTGAYYFFQINLESCYSQIYFKQEGKPRFKLYTPDQIKGYSFNFKDQDYYFHSFLIQSKSIVRSEQSRYAFLILIKKTRQTSIYRSQRYMMKQYDESVYNYFSISTNIIPQYTYYYHKNKSDRIIDHKSQWLTHRITYNTL